MKIFNVVAFLFALTLLTGCNMIESENSGSWFLNLFVNPFSVGIEGMATVFNGNYGLAIIMITVIIRFLLMPMTLKQQKQSKLMKEKLDVIKPKLEEIQQELQKATTPEKQKELQLKTVQLYQQHGVNPLSIGCLPMLIQMPILMGLYYAISHSENIASHSFLWFDLGSPDLLLAFIASAVYFLQMHLSLRNVPKEQQSQMKIIGLISPLMIGFISIGAPAALPLYWMVGGIFLIFQTLIVQKWFLTSRNRSENVQ
jgi:YidC/Oxa1 family membrane protein insertase